MKISILVITAVAVITSAPLAVAASAKNVAPGQQMNQRGSVAGSPGASGYAPGHLKKRSLNQSASKYAPGHKKNIASPTTIRSTTGAAVR